MANNKQPVVNAVQTKPVEVSQQLQDGEKFVKWDEVSGLFKNLFLSFMLFFKFITEKFNGSIIYY